MPEIIKASPFNSGQPVAPGAFARVTNGYSGTLNGWFGPGSALPVQAPVGTQVRAFDYDFGINLNTTVRPYAAIPPHRLREFSRAYPLLRLAIEKMKDRICSKTWTIQPLKDGSESPADYKKRAQGDASIQQLIQLFRKPDGENVWRKWLRKLLEDHLVLDAGTVAPERKGYGSKTQIYRLLIVDGGTIIRKIDEQGLTPTGVDGDGVGLPAYQQIIKGLSAVDFTKSELLYAAENIPSHGLYGYSRVEQVLQLTILGLNRLVHQTSFYTEGSVPDVFGFLPEGTTPEETAKWDALFQRFMSGNSANKRKVWWMPYTGQAPVTMKDKDLTDKMDELLNRYICWCFGLSPSAIVPQVNRAAAGQMADDADEAGETPVSAWVVDTLNELIQSPFYFNRPDLEFAFVEQTEVDNLVQKEIDQIDFAMAAQTGNGIEVLNEIRDREGKPRLVDNTPPPPTQLPPEEEDGPNGSNAANASPPATPKKAFVPRMSETMKQRKAASEVLTIDPGKDTPAKAKARKAIAGALTDFLAEQGKSLAAAVSVEYARQKVSEPVRGKVKPSADENEEGDDFQATADDVLAKVAVDWSDLPTLIESFLQQAATSGVAQAGTSVSASHDIFSQANEWAIAYGESRAAELVGMKLVDGKMVENPDAKWAITETTRNGLRDLIVKALEEGTPVAGLKTQIEQSALFSQYRAEMIATTEVNFANSGGQFEVGSLVGHTSKRSLLSGDHDQDDECDDNAAQDAVPIAEPFPNGSMYSPFHPWCVCLTQTFTPGKEL